MLRKYVAITAISDTTGCKMFNMALWEKVVKRE